MAMIRWSLFVVALTTGALTTGALATTPKAPSSNVTPNVKSPNIILITLDTTRADRMGFLGSKRGLTPNLESRIGSSWSM
jgi:hypothetical protein